MGYGWVVATSSVFIWFIGPSAFASYGRLVETMDLSYSYLIWILNAMFCSYFTTAVWVVPFVRSCTHRKVALVGCLLAACGFLLSSSGRVHDSPFWLFASLSAFVGIGFGLAIHATFLLVASHFTNNRGLANGFGVVSSGLGYLFSPYLYEWAKSPKDRLHLRALTAAIAFMAASFYLSPSSQIGKSGEVEVSRMSRKSIGNNKSAEDNGSRENEVFPRESIPLVEKYEDSDQIPGSNGALRPRRKSQFMIAIAGTLLPNIPEESESQYQSMQNFPTITDNSENVNNEPISSKCSSFEILVSEETRSEINKNVPCLDIELRLTKFHKRNDDFSAKSVDSSFLLSEIGTDENVRVESVQENVNNIVSKKEVILIDSSQPTQMLSCSSQNADVTSRDMDTDSGTKKFFTHQNTAKESKPTTTNNHSSQSTEKLLSLSRNCCCPFAKIININFKLLTNITFLNMAFGSALTVLIVPNFPLILYAHVTRSQIESKKGSEVVRNDTAEIVLMIIFIMDLLSRLITSYLSDFSFFNRRIGFLCGALCGAFIIAGIGFIEDIRLIYALCVPYGISFGVLVATESLMFADVFGIDQLESTYGLVGLLKTLLILITSSTFMSPCSVFIYNVHPIWHWHTKMNNTICNNCDPFDLFSSSDHIKDVSHLRYLLGLTASPGLICAIMWSIEYVCISYRIKNAIH